MGNTNSTQIAQLNLSKNLLPQNILNEYNNLIISDIFSNIGNDVANLPNYNITQTQLNNLITNLDLYSQVVNSISYITASNTLQTNLDMIIKNAMNENNTPLELLDFNTKINSIQPNINGDFIVVNNQHFINLISNIVKNNLDVNSLKNCFLTHLSNLSNLNTDNAQSIVQNSISTCTEMNHQISIITKNMCDSLNITITLTNTIKTPKEYIAQFQAQYNTLQEQYNLYNAEITGPEFIAYNDDKENLKKLHEIKKKMKNITSEQLQIESKITILEKQPYFTPETLALIEGKIKPKNGIDVSGNQSINYQFETDEKHVDIMNKQQKTKQKDNISNNLTNNQNIDSSSNINLKINREIDKTKYSDKESGLFGKVPQGVRIFLSFCCSLLLLISILASLFFISRARGAVKIASKAKDIASNVNNN